MYLERRADDYRENVISAVELRAELWNMKVIKLLEFKIWHIKTTHWREYVHKYTHSSGRKYLSSSVGNYSRS